MRTTRLLPTVFLASGLLLAACGDDEPDDGTAVSEGGVAVSGEFGDKPTLEVPGAEPPAELQVEVISEGDGPEVGADDFVVAHYLGQTWEPRDPADVPDQAPPTAQDSGSPAPEETTAPEEDEGSAAEPYIFDNSYDREEVAGFSLNRVITGWKDGLAGQKVGSRVLLTIPPDQGYGDQPESDLAEDTLIFVVDLVDSVAPDAAAAGEPVADLPQGLPTVKGGETGPPTLDFADSEAPGQSSTTVLVEGDGEELGSNVVVQMMEAPFPDGEGAQSTWDLGAPETVPVEGLQSLPGWDGVSDNLTVGTRILTLISSEEATGDAEEEQPALALVVDIVGTY